MKPEQELAKYFYDSTGLRFTGTVYSKQIYAAKSLLKVYSLEECKDCVDYLIKYPPRNGFNSLAYLQYVIDETLLKIKSEAIKDVQYVYEPELPIKADDDNRKKYEANNKPKLKGMMGI
jgi:ssDNA-binding Zn-finger/Zn-ribbon topoisomerase 1